MYVLESIWDVIYLLFWGFIFVAALFALFTVISDLIRDRELSGWWKAVWIVFLVFIPLLTSLVYIIARGKGMAERTERVQKNLVKANEDYIRGVAGDSKISDLSAAAALLDSGHISAEEFDVLKKKALA